MTTRVDPAFNREDLRLVAAKAAQARLSGVLPKGDAPDPVAVDRIALIYARQNRLIEFDVEELFGADGWERYLNGFAELAGMEREREMEADGMSMMA